jgi:hypothetical protein
VLQERKELEQKLIEVIQTSKLKTRKKQVNDIKKHLAQYDIIDTVGWLNDPEGRLPELDVRELLLFSEQIFAKTGDLSVNPEDYFTKAEFDDARQFSGTVERMENQIEFPITIPNVTVVGNSAYMATVDIQTIDKLIGNGLLDYNYDLQREATYRRVKNEVKKEPTLVMSNVKEISQHLLEGTLVPTVLVWNAAVRTSETGTELSYNSNTLELTIEKGTALFIVDGYHRCKASQNALQSNPELHFNFGVLITNYSTKKAQQYQAQLAKATPISKTRIQELEANRLSDTVVQQLKEESDLKGRISQTNRIHSLNKEIVTYNVLSDVIDEEFKMETRADAADVGDYLTEYFNILIGDHQEAFLTNIEETRKTTLINDNNFFIGYVVLARRLFEANLRAREIRKYIRNIDFSRDNKDWISLGILDENKNLTETNKLRKAIKKYFENIDIETNVEIK